MYAVCVTFKIKPDQFDAFLPLMMRQAETSLTSEPGCYRFDVCVGEEGVGDVFLYELYEDTDAFALHLKTRHFEEFDTAVAEMVAGKQVSTYTRLV